MQTVTPTPVVWEANPYIVDLRELGKLTFLMLLVIILLSLLLKIILDLRKYHYKG